MNDPRSSSAPAGRAETVFVILTLLLYTGAIVFTLRAATANADIDPNTGDPVFQAIWLFVDTIVFLLLAKNWRTSIPAMRGTALVWALVALAVASPLWSSAPQVTTRRSIALVGTTLFGVYFAARFSLRRQVSLLAWALGLGVISSFVFVFALPSYGIEGGGDWKGAFLTKNVMGRAMTLSLIVFLLCAWKGRSRKFVLGSLAVLAALLLLGAGSSTALVVLPLAIASLFSTRILKWPTGLSMPLLVMALALSSAAAIWTSDNFAEALGAAGRDPTLTGRTQLWDDVIVQIEDKPWLGYGYGGFWLGWDGPSAKIWEETTWQPPHAHNGLLDLWLDLGAVGVVLFIAGFATVFFRALKLAQRAKEKAELLPIAFLVFMFLYNLSESTILRQNSIFWVLYVAVATAVLSRTPLIAQSPKDEEVLIPTNVRWALDAKGAQRKVRLS